MKEFNTLKDFNTKLIVSLKTRNNILTKSDFLKMKRVYPDSYNNAFLIYEKNDPKLLQEKIKIALQEDANEITSIRDDRKKHVEIQYNILSSISNKCMEETYNVLNSISEKVSSYTTIPKLIITGVNTSIMINKFSRYIKNQNENQNILTENNIEDFYVQTYINENNSEHIMKECLSQLNESEYLGFSESVLVILGFLYLKAAISCSMGVELKQKAEILLYALPGAAALTILSILLGMVSSSTVL